MEDYTKSHLGTFSGVPKEIHLKPGDKLFKLVDESKVDGPSSTTPFWATEEQMRAWKTSGQSAADFFGLPIGSHADSYVEYVMEVKEATTVLVGKVAPTFERVPGLPRPIATTGGGGQAVVSNRSAFTDPVKKEIHR
jgi:hypothetical protein